VRTAVPTFAVRLSSVVVLIVLWEVAADIAGSRRLPSATSVLLAIADEIAHGALVHHLAMTLFRVSVSFVLAMSIGTAAGFVLGRWRMADAALDSWIMLLLNLPALVVIVLAYIWFGLTEASAIGAVTLNKLPLVIVTVREGARALDPDYAEVARAFRIGTWRRLRHIVFPQLAPFLFVSARSGLSLIWKIVLVVELLGRSDGVGFQIQIFFQLFDVTRVLAYAIAFIAVVQAIEWSILQPLERRIGRWRR
jgi:NitT/TauT family transport system permease protein